MILMNRKKTDTFRLTFSEYIPQLDYKDKISQTAQKLNEQTWILFLASNSGVPVCSAYSSQVESDDRCGNLFTTGVGM